MTDTTETKVGFEFRRRTVLKGAAWTAPAVVMVAATPAHAASLSWTINAPAPFITQANVTDFTISGTGVTDRVVTLTVPGLSPSPTTTVDANGAWSFTLDLSSLQEGTVSFTPTTANAAFSPSTVTSVKDTVAGVTLSSINGGANQTTISGAAEAGSTSIELAIAVAPATPDTFASAGLTGTNWTTTRAVANNGIYNVRVRGTDARGNVSTYSFQFRHDNSQPVSPVPTLTLV